jgi:hypothetical protein
VHLGGKQAVHLMAYPNTPSERRSFADGWRPENDPHGAAHIWKVEADGKFLRYEAEYFSGGRSLDIFTGASIASVIRGSEGALLTSA